jgi:5-formyltetrahydrofolate cyclo-ligase
MSSLEMMTFDPYYTKKQARLWAKAKRSIILSTPAVCEGLNAALKQRVETLLQHLKPSTIACYAALPHEPNLNWLWQHIQEDTQRNSKGAILLPRLSKTDGEPMVFCELPKEAGGQGLQGMKEHLSMAGLWEPASHLPPYTQPIDLMLIPALAMDKQGVRLGYGKGYYDRYLAHATAQGLRPKHLVGVCWQACVVERLPQQSHDIKLDAVLTEIACFGS